MCAKWNSSYDPHLLAERIESSCKRGAKGEVSFGMEHHEYESVLRSSLILSDEIPESEIGGVVWKGIVATAKAGQITADALKTEITKTERKFLKLPLIRFVVVTNLSLAPTTSLTRRPRKDSIISIGGLHHGKFDPSPIMDHARGLWLNGAALRQGGVSVMAELKISGRFCHHTMASFPAYERSRSAAGRGERHG